MKSVQYIHIKLTLAIYNFDQHEFCNTEKSLLVEIYLYVIYNLTFRITFQPTLKTFEMDIAEKMGIKDDRVPTKVYWY